MATTTSTGLKNSIVDTARGEDDSNKCAPLPKRPPFCQCTSYGPSVSWEVYSRNARPNFSIAYDTPKSGGDPPPVATRQRVCPRFSCGRSKAHSHAGSACVPWSSSYLGICQP